MTSLFLAWLATGSTRPSSILDSGRPVAPVEQSAPAVPAEPAVPLSR